jgi:hypothetical protein
MAAPCRSCRAGATCALRWLERAFRQKDCGLYFVKGDLLMRSLEPDPRYRAFLRTMNYPD